MYYTLLMNLVTSANNGGNNGVYYHCAKIDSSNKNSINVKSQQYEVSSSKVVHSRASGAERPPRAGRWLKLPHLLHVYTKLYQYFMRIYTSYRDALHFAILKISTQLLIAK